MSRKTFRFLSFLLKIITNYKTNFRTWHVLNLYHKHSIFMWIMWITLWITHFIRIFLPHLPVDKKLSTGISLIWTNFVLSQHNEKKILFCGSCTIFVKSSPKNEIHNFLYIFSFSILISVREFHMIKAIKQMKNNIFPILYTNNSKVNQGGYYVTRSIRSRRH